MTKKKNTGIQDSNQGHRAKMNSSDRSGYDQEDSEGWNEVLSKSSRKRLQKQSRVEEKQKVKRSASKSKEQIHSHSPSASRGAPQAQRDADDEVRSEGEQNREDCNFDKESGAQRSDLSESAQTEGEMERDDYVPVDSDSSASGRASNKEVKKACSPLKRPDQRVVPETPAPAQTQAEKGKKRIKVARVNAADGLTLDEMMDDIVKSGEHVKPRDIDPSSKPPAPGVVREAAEMLIAKGSEAPRLDIGIPSTKRRQAARTRLRRTLGCNFVQAERLLTCSALTHDHGKESYAHALALGKYLKHGAQMEDGAEEHRILLRKQLQKLGYKVEQVNLALKDLEASLGVLNVTASEVQGWLVRQALAYDENQQRHIAREMHPDSAKHPRAEHADTSIPGCKGHGCELNEKVQKQFQKVDLLLRANGMVEAADAIRQATDAQSPSSKQPGTPATESDAKAQMNTVSKLHDEWKNDDPYWNKPPAVKQFLLARTSMHLQMTKLSTIPPAQLLRTFDIQIATWPTFMEAVHRFPEACGIKYELSEFYQCYLEEAKVTIQELELGSRMFLADILERNTDLVMQQLNGNCSRKLVEAEFVKEFKRSGNGNEAVQYVCRVLREPSVPTPSWRQILGKEEDTPRALGASYRIGQQARLGASTRRKIAGRETARIAAQQEVAIETATPPKETRYRNTQAVSTLRKMLKEDPELGNLPAEQQLRIAARRVIRRIDFAEALTKESRANKRTASKREDDSDDEEDSAPSANGDKCNKPAMKAKRPNAQVNSGQGDGDESPLNSERSDGSGGEDSPNGSSDGSDDGDDSEDEKEDSDSAGSSCRSSDDDSRESEQQHDTRDGFCVDDDDANADGKCEKAKKEGRKQPKQDDVSASTPASKRASSVNSLGTPKKSEGSSSVSQGGNIYFGEDELKRWTTGSEKYKQGFNWPAYTHHKQNYDNYCQFKGVHAARTFKSVIHARLVPALCGFCGLKRSLWKEYEDA